MTSRYWALIILTIIVFFFGCKREQNSPEANADTPSTYILSTSDLPDYETDIDHAGLISSESEEFYHKGMIVYRIACFNCHGNPETPGSLPNSHKFWQDTFKMGNDPYAIYQTLSKGFGMMAPQVQLTPQEKYEVIAYIRQEFVKDRNKKEFFEVDSAYLESLTKGTSFGPEPKEYKPWAEMDYGNHLVHTYELANTDDPPRERSDGIGLLANEDYSDYNFAYKGIAMRLDKGDGGVAQGNVFALFDHDLMRFTGFWSGSGFIDYRGILLNDEHNIYPRTVGTIQVENPIMPGWANPKTGDYDDPRYVAPDGRPFGPLPREWAHYKGLYKYEDKTIIQYTVGDAEVLEMYTLEESGDNPTVSRTLNVKTHSQNVQVRIAPSSAAVAIENADLEIEQSSGYHIININANQQHKVKIFLSKSNQEYLNTITKKRAKVENLEKYTKGGPAQYQSQVLESPIISGNANDAYAVDVFVLPLENPWKSRMRLTGIDFIKNGEEALVTTVDGEVWRLEGITNESGNIKWHRIATGLFQPLGIKYHNGQIYVGCRDQIVRLHDLNSDGEADYYESFNSDHMVTEHFHEFAMGLQVDAKDNFYYAKSARHARTALTPHHGTLIKVSHGGDSTSILAGGFRAANGVCMNPDGSFYVTDQEGHWNPMNRINRVTEGGWYGNMYTLQAPADTSNSAMSPPMAWVDLKYDRSPAELLWVNSDRWGPLNNKLLSLSYGYGKIFHVLTENTSQGEQGGIVELPIPQFPTGVIRARFNPADGQMYTCGMSAWATSQMIQVGGLYRVRYTGKSLNFPVAMKVVENEIHITFSEKLNSDIVTQVKNYQINTWDLLRSRRYGSDRHNVQNLTVKSASLSSDKKTVIIQSDEIKPTWVMEIMYKLRSKKGKFFSGVIQNTVHKVGNPTL